VPAHAVDFGLALRIVLAADRHLGAERSAALEAFLARWLALEREAIAERFTDRDEGFERFVASVTGTTPSGADPRGASGASDDAGRRDGRGTDRPV
jgi:hypothetical protein